MQYRLTATTRRTQQTQHSALGDKKTTATAITCDRADEQMSKESLRFSRLYFFHVTASMTEGLACDTYG